MKRGYFVTGCDTCWGIPVVASTAKEAKAIAWKHWKYELDCEWIEVKVNWRRQARIDDLPIGVVEDDLIALRAKLIDYLEG